MIRITKTNIDATNSMIISQNKRLLVVPYLVLISKNLSANTLHKLRVDLRVAPAHPDVDLVRLFISTFVSQLLLIAM